jgi:hypothetical protein
MLSSKQIFRGDLFSTNKALQQVIGRTVTTKDMTITHKHQLLHQQQQQSKYSSSNDIDTAKSTAHAAAVPAYNSSSSNSNINSKTNGVSNCCYYDPLAVDYTNNDSDDNYSTYSYDSTDAAAAAADTDMYQDTTHSNVSTVHDSTGLIMCTVHEAVQTRDAHTYTTHCFIQQARLQYT